MLIFVFLQYSEHLTANNYTNWPSLAQYGYNNNGPFQLGDRSILSPNIGNYNVDPTTTAELGLTGPTMTSTLGQPGSIPPGYLLSTGGTAQTQESTATTSSLTPKVMTTLGPVTGKLVRTPNGIRYRAFLAIPYADFQGRFKKPAQASAWEGVFDASEYRQRCVYQARNLTKEGERCHYLKILAPENPFQTYPVIFWPHGGGFSAGANDDYNNDALADILVAKGVIIVQPNYRVGAFGFWSLGTKEAPGNYAMWDVLEALKWVNREIKAFGGDPSRVICHGQGAGSVVCDLLGMSPKAHGLLSALSMWSGQIFSPKIDRDDAKNLADFARFATAVDCDDEKHSLWNSPTNRTKILACMEKKSLQEIIGGMAKVGHGVAGFCKKIVLFKLNFSFKLLKYSKFHIKICQIVKNLLDFICT